MNDTPENQLRDSMRAHVSAAPSNMPELTETLFDSIAAYRRRRRVALSLLGGGIAVAVVLTPVIVVKAMDNVPRQVTGAPSTSSTSGQQAPSQINCRGLDQTDHRFDRVILRREATGTQIKLWLKTREGDVYSEDIVARFHDDERFVVCGVMAHGFKLPGPFGSPDPQAASVILSQNTPPFLDAVSTPGKIKELVSKLP